MLADNDFYQFTMSQWAWLNYKDVEVRYKFFCRSPINLLENLDLAELNYDLDNLFCNRDLRSINLLQSNGLYLFDSNWLIALVNTDMPLLEAQEQDGQFHLEYEGPWWSSMLIETPLLACINEHYNKDLWDWKQQQLELEARLEEKIQWLKKRPYIKFFEFGTRRRNSLEWQSNVLQRLTELPAGQFLGTSNPHWAQLYGVPVKGTMAHQMFMVDLALELAVGNKPKESLSNVLYTWQELYGKVWDGSLLILLTDTFGTDWLLNNLDPEIMHNWHGFRQDSGDPIEWGHKIINWCNKVGINTKEKLLCFSDALDLAQMDKIYSEFASKADIAFGWGTNLTNDGLEKPISIVVKPIKCWTSKTQQLPCIKLSDNLAKATGSEAVINYYKYLLGYTNEFEQATIY